MTSPSRSVPLPVALPFHADALLRFLADRAVSGVETTGDGWYARTLSLPGGPATIRLDFPCDPAGADAVGDVINGEAVVTATMYLADPADETEAAARCRALIGADVDAAAVHEALAADPALAGPVAAAPGVRVPGAVDGAEILTRALVGQQISVAAARTALGKLTVAADERVPSPIEGLTHLFPSPARIAELGAGAIAGPRRRAAAIAAAAVDMASGALTVDAGHSVAELTFELVSRPGIGPWTAGYVAMRVLAEPDVLLTGDLALRNGAAALGIPADPRALAAYGARWSPFRSFAGMYLWRSCPPPRRSRAAAVPPPVRVEPVPYIP